MQHEFPKHYYDPFQGCLMRQDDADTLTYYYIEYQVLNHPRGKDQNAWPVTVTTRQGYCISNLLHGSMGIAHDKFERLLGQCKIKSPTFDDPLPSWFSLPFRGSQET